MIIDGSTPPVKRRKWQNKKNMEKTFQIFNQGTDDGENKENNMQEFISLPNISRKLNSTKTIGKIADSDVDEDEDEDSDKTIQVPNDETFTPDHQKSTSDTTFIPEKSNPASDLTFIPVDPILGQKIHRDNNIPEIKLPHPENAQKPMFPSIDRNTDLRTPSPDFINSTVTEFSFIKGLQANLSKAQYLSPKKLPWNQNIPRSSSPIRNLESASRIRARRRNHSRNGSRGSSRNNSGNHDITPPVQLSVAEKRERRLMINKRYSVLPNVKPPRTPKVEYQEKFKFDPDDHETKENSINFIEKHCKIWLQQVLAPVNWETSKIAKGKKNLCKYRLIFQDFYRNQVKPEMALTYQEIDSDKFILRDRKDLKDVGKMNRLAKFITDTVNPIWLVLTVEAILHAVLPLNALKDSSVRRKILKTQFFIKEGSTLLKNQKSGASKNQEKWFLRRCFELFKFLDMAKDLKLIDEDPPLFEPGSKLAGGTKSSLNFLTEWSTKFLGKEGSIQKHLKRLNYELTYTQKTIDEIDVNIENLATDLQNGVRIAKLLQTSDVSKYCDSEVDVIQALRFNPGAKSDIPRMSREFNWKQVFKVCQFIQLDLSFNKKDEEGFLEITQLASGHMEQTLGFVVKLIRHFWDQYRCPSMEILEKLEAFVKLFLLDSPSEKKLALEILMKIRIQAAIKIQSWWRNFKIAKYEKQKIKIIKIQNWWRNKRLELEIERRIYLKKKTKQEKLEAESALKIQTWWRMISARCLLQKLKLEKIELEKRLLREKQENDAVLVLQRFVRCYQAKMKLHKLRELEKIRLLEIQKERERQSAIVIQSWWRKEVCRQHYNKITVAVSILQRNFRIILAKKQLEILKEEKREKIRQERIKLENKSAVKIQSWYKCQVQRKKFISIIKQVVKVQSMVRKFLAVKAAEALRAERDRLILERRQNAAVVIQKNFRMLVEKRKFQNSVKNVIIVQNLVRKFLAVKVLKQLKLEREILILEQKTNAAIVIQKNFRTFVEKRKFKRAVKKVIIVQSMVRKFLSQKKLEKLKEQKRIKSAVTIQRTFRGHTIRKDYLLKKKSAITIQENFRRFRNKNIVLSGLEKRKAAVVLQKYFRGKMDRKRVKELIIKMRLAKEKRERDQLEDKSVRIMQKIVRGWLVRNKVDKKVMERRNSLAKLKPEDVPSLNEITEFNIRQLKSFQTTKELNLALKGLINAVELLPQIQSFAIIEGKGLNAILEFMMESTQTPDHIAITTIGLELAAMVFPYLQPNESCIDELLLHNVNIMVRDKFAYKQIENTKCLKASLTLHNRASKCTWGKELFNAEASKVQVKRLKEMKSAYRQIMSNPMKYKNKPLWLRNCREVSKELIESELGHGIVNCTV